MADNKEEKNEWNEDRLNLGDGQKEGGDYYNGAQVPIGDLESDEENKYDNRPLVDISDDKPYKENFEKIKKEFAEAAKDGTLYKKYSEYLKRYDEILRNPDFADSVDEAKKEISQLKAAYFDAAGLSKKICPECGQIHEKDAKFSTCHGSEMYVVGKCRSCGADLSSAQEYSAINSCPKCGAELTVPQKKIMNGILVKTPAKTKYVCSKCGKVYDSAIRHCQDCGSRILAMQCGKCGEVLCQNEEGQFDKYCPVCGMLNPAEVEKINQKQKEQLRKQAEEAEKRRLVEAEKERIRQEYEEKLKAALSEIKKQQEQSYQATARQAAAQQYKIGDTIQFGSYPFYADGREKAIDWIILDIDADGNALVISDYALDNVKYHEEDEDITWEDSSIRKWLNGTFINKVFTATEQAKIMTTTVRTADNIIFSDFGDFDGYSVGRGGNATNDKLFLMSIEEAKKYFKDEESRIAYPTPYAKSKKSVNGNLTVSKEIVSTDRGGSCWWWLRSPGYRGYDQNYAANVRYGGFVNAYGLSVDREIGGVRAALKINLNNL